MRFFFAGLVALAVLVASAYLSFELPGTNVPQTAQTLAVLLLGALAGPGRAGALIGAYLVLGAAGLPVFAGGKSGLDALQGPTGGFLLGFLPAAVAAGWAYRQFDPDRANRWYWMLAAMAGGHALILLAGWSRLALLTGPGPAYLSGVAPFVIGALVKSVALLPLLALWERLRSRLSAHRPEV